MSKPKPLTVADADQIATWAKNTFADLVDNAIRLTPPSILHDPSAAGFMTSLYAQLPAGERTILLAHAVAVEARRLSPLDTTECKAGRCAHVRCPDAAS